MNNKDSPIKNLTSSQISSSPCKDKVLTDNLNIKFLTMQNTENNCKESQTSKKTGDTAQKFTPIDISSIKNLNQENKQLTTFIKILNKPLKEREKLDKDFLKTFLINNEINSVISDDLKYFNLEIDTYFNYILDYFVLKIYNYLDIIYYNNEEPDNFYYILNEGKVGLYKKETTEEILSYEEYLLYLYDQLNLCEKNKIQNYQKTNIENYIDNILLNEIVNENSKIYPIFTIDDIKDIKEIILKIKLYKLLNKKETEIDYSNYIELENPNLKNRKQIIKIYNDIKLDFSFFNYDKVISEVLSYEKYKNYIIENFIQRDKFYMKYLNRNNNYSVKKMKYVKISNITYNNYFGNFSANINDNNNQNNKKKILLRDIIARCESENLLVVQFFKKKYTEIITNSLKKANEKMSAYFHERYIFSDINFDYFQKKIYNNFKKETHFKNDVICYQNQNMNNFIMVKEGTSQLIMYNISLFELKNKIYSIKGLLLDNAKYFKNSNNKILEKIYELEIDVNTNLQMKVAKEIIHKKQNIVISQCNEGLFGEYEFFFNIPCLLSLKLTSEKADFYYYPYEKYKQLNINSTNLNEKLKECAFNKLLNILKRMFSVYNSYWRILNERYSDTKNEISETEINKSYSLISQIKNYLNSDKNEEKNSNHNLLNKGYTKSNSSKLMLTEIDYINDNRIRNNKLNEEKEEFICCSNVNKESNGNSIVNANFYMNKRLITLYSSRNQKRNEDYELEKINKLICTKNKINSNLRENLFNTNKDNNMKIQFNSNFFKKQFNPQNNSISERKRNFNNKNIAIDIPNIINFKKAINKKENSRYNKNTSGKINESKNLNKFILPPIKLKIDKNESIFQDHNISGEYKIKKFTGKSVDEVKKYNSINKSFSLKNTGILPDVCKIIMDMRNINNNFDIKKARINLIKYRKHRILNSWDKNFADDSWGEYYYMRSNK